MSDRNEFKAWACEPFDEWWLTYLEKIGVGGYIRVSDMRAAWQASRAAALEEAAKECDLMQAVFERQARGGDNTGASDFRADAAERCAVGIRALKDAP